MNDSWYMVGSDVAPVLVRVLGHTLWQAMAVSVLLWLILRQLPAKQAQMRYGFCAAALVAVVVSSFVTASLVSGRSGGYRAGAQISDHYSAAGPALEPDKISPPGDAVGREPGSALTQPTGQPGPVAVFPSPMEGRIIASPHPGTIKLMWWLAVAWLAGTFMMLVRLVSSLWGAGRLRRSGKIVTDPHAVRLLEEARAAFRIARAVSLQLSNEVVSPVVLGFFRPVILLPCSFVTGMSPEVIRAALLHEMAHIRRHDYLVNLGQMLIEALLFFNPCVWWISAQLRLEREACCDLLAVGVTEDAWGYVSALTQAAVSGAGSASARPGLGLASGSPGSLVNRVRRLLLPQQPSSLRLPWYSVVIAVITWVLILGGLWTGSATGVALAQKALSSQARIDMIEKAEQDYGVPPEQRLGIGDQRTTVSGTVMLPDEKLLESRAIIQTVSLSPRMTSGGGLTVRDGRFEGQITPGRVYMGVKYSGYAPALAGPYRIKPETPLTDLVFVLNRGYPSNITITNEQEKPLAGVKVKVHYSFPDSRNPVVTVEAETNKAGIAAIENATTWPVVLMATAPGYEPARHELERLPNGEPLTWELRRSKPTRGQVTDSVTGEPVANAALMLARTRGGEGNSYKSLTTATVADASGNFVLDNLRDDTRYDFLVQAPPRRPAWLADVTAGETGLKVMMGEPLVLEGTVAGRPEKCQVWNYQLRRRIPAVTVTDRLMYPDDNYSDQREYIVPLEIHDGVGHFTVGGLAAGSVQVRWDAGVPKELELDLQESMRGLELSTESGEGTGTEWARPAPPAEGSTRSVVLRFSVPHGAPPPTGTMFLNYSGMPGDSNSAMHSPIPITGQEMQFVVKVPSGISYMPHGTLGYWFEDGSITVPAGTEKFKHEIVCYPAGSISGVALDPQGNPAPDANISVNTIEAPAALTDKGGLGPDMITVNNDGRFHITPLPLGGSYRVKVFRDNNFVLSDVLQLTSAAPLQTITAQFSQGQGLDVRVIDEEGVAVSGAPAQLKLKSENSIYIIANLLTDRAGKLHVNGLNPKIDGGYRLELPIRKNYRPAGMTVKPGKTQVEIELKSGLSAHGRVINHKDGKPLSGATVFAWPRHAPVSAAKDWVSILAENPTDEEGNFKFSNLPEGEFFFRVQMLGSVNEPTAKAGSDELVEVLVSAPPGWTPQ